jgi:tRNA (cmo5U34)-methyltransferase
MPFDESLAARIRDALKDEAYRDHVFAYVEKEDTPRPLLFQLDLLCQVGFSQIEVLRKNICFAAFGAVKS